MPDVEAQVSEHGSDLVIFGHSHKPYAGRLAVSGGGRGCDCFFFNPGSAGKKRFSLPRTVGRLVGGPGGGLTGRLISLEGRAEDEMEFTAPAREINRTKEW